ncbi:hypothetical protein POM88_046680 [Heracleum sosnowskyi]|uniref:Uncharacterized protein n=1 Tax=Heracleum sosnowskyi TaxID=360622 RepID=A0AAD8M693_9APIA|nr:hypothetical protein POM88_046680 [Heracleum sosnowskyi]
MSTKLEGNQIWVVQQVKQDQLDMGTSIEATDFIHLQTIGDLVNTELDTQGQRGCNVSKEKGTEDLSYHFTLCSMNFAFDNELRFAKNCNYASFRFFSDSYFDYFDSVLRVGVLLYGINIDGLVLNLAGVKKVVMRITNWLGMINILYYREFLFSRFVGLYSVCTLVLATPCEHFDIIRHASVTLCSPEDEVIIDIVCGVVNSTIGHARINVTKVLAWIRMDVAAIVLIAKLSPYLSNTDDKDAYEMFRINPCCTNCCDLQNKNSVKGILSHAQAKGQQERGFRVLEHKDMFSPRTGRFSVGAAGGDATVEWTRRCRPAVVALGDGGLCGGVLLDVLLDMGQDGQAGVGGRITVHGCNC